MDESAHAFPNTALLCFTDRACTAEIFVRTAAAFQLREVETGADC